MPRGDHRAWGPGCLSPCTAGHPAAAPHGEQCYSRYRYCTSNEVILFGVNLKVKGSVVDPNTLNLDPDPGCWPNLDPDQGLY